MKKLTMVFVLALFTQAGWADTCPSVEQVKKHLVTGWNVYDSDDGTRLSGERKAEFIKDIEAFALAEWAEKDRKKNTIHCYYRDHEGSALEAYIAKDNFIPAVNQYWYQVSGSKQCAAGMEQCNFASPSLLAKK